MKYYFLLHNINMSEKTVEFSDVDVNKKKIHAPKQRITLNLIDIVKIVTSNKFKHNNNATK